MDVREVGDLLTAGIPLGYTFGRLGNFINGELYGRVTAAPIGMVFPNAARFSVKLDWVREIATKTGTALPASGTVNLPRHPSQLYEALFEGVVLWVVLWALRKRRPFKGFILGLYLIGYGAARFVIEYFREPDADLGYRLRFVDDGVPPALFSSPFNFSTGQILCFLMIVAGAVWLAVAARLPQEGPAPAVNAEASGAAAEKAAEQKKRRKIRKKLK
jgi:phosphatidylglycerol:prolipoprotein diacylglycerol transferase